MTKYLLRFTRATLRATDWLGELIARVDVVIHAAANFVVRVGEFAHRRALDLSTVATDKKALAAGNAALQANYRLSRAKDVLARCQAQRDEADRIAEATRIAVNAEKAELGLA